MCGRPPTSCYVCSVAEVQAEASVSPSHVSSSLGPADLHFRDRGGRAGIFMPRQIHAPARLPVPAIRSLHCVLPPPFAPRPVSRASRTRCESRRATPRSTGDGCARYDLRFAIPQHRVDQSPHHRNIRGLIATRGHASAGWLQLRHEDRSWGCRSHGVRRGQAGEHHAAQAVTPPHLGKPPSAETKSRREEERKRRANVARSTVSWARREGLKKPDAVLNLRNSRRRARSSSALLTYLMRVCSHT